MIIDLFILFILLSLCLLVIGKYIDAPPIQMGAYLFFFILGLIVLTGNLTYKAGSNTIVNTLNNVTTNITINPVYTSFTSEAIMGVTINHVFGFYICILSALGFVIVLFNLKSGINIDEGRLN